MPTPDGTTFLVAQDEGVGIKIEDDLQVSTTNGVEEAEIRVA
jgi:hypothetical protein